MDRAVAIVLQQFSGGCCAIIIVSLYRIIIISSNRSSYSDSVLLEIRAFKYTGTFLSSGRGFLIFSTTCLNFEPSFASENLTFTLIKKRDVTHGEPEQSFRCLNVQKWENINFLFIGPFEKCLDAIFFQQLLFSSSGRYYLPAAVNIFQQPLLSSSRSYYLPAAITIFQHMLLLSSSPYYLSSIIKAFHTPGQSLEE